MILGIRLVNLGAQPHRFVIADLSIDQTLQSVELIDLPIDAPDGSYEWAIYEGHDAEQTVIHTREFALRGQLRLKPAQKMRG